MNNDDDLKLIAKSDVFAKWGEAYDFAAPYLRNDKYVVKTSIMGGVGTRVRVFEKVVK